MRIDNEVLAVLSASQTAGLSLVLPAQLDRSLYMRTNKVLEAAGGVWNRKAKAHLFSADAAERMDQIILSGSVEVPRDEFQFFESTPSVVARLLHHADIKPGMSVLEPQVGRGAIAFACAALGAKVDAIELEEGNYRAVLNDPRLNSVLQGDFLATTPVPVYDRVVGNPPFRAQADIKHTLHALGFLAPRGKLITVLSAGASFRTDKRATAFRELVAARGGLIEPLPENSFKASGTAVNTVIAVIPAA